MNRKDLQQLASDRLLDADILLKAQRWSAAYYLAGYAVECALKACIAKLMKSDEFPDKNFADKCWTHDIEKLLTLAGLKDVRDADSAADADLSANWGIVKDWKESNRYDIKTETQALELLEAINEANHGVLPWIKSRW